MKSEHISFTKALFFGDVLEDMVYPYPEINPQEKESLQLLFESIHKFAEEHVDSHKIDKEAKIPQTTIDKMKELGLFGLIIPEKYGGFGFSQTAYEQTLEKVAAYDASIALTAGAHSSIGIKGLLFFGTEEQKKKYLPKLATGEMIGAFALTEPTAGSDAASIKTRAELTPDGKHYILNGTKIWITNANHASFFTVFAQTKCEDGKDRISTFIVTRDMEGFSTGREEEKLGIKGTSTASVNFNNCKVPRENLLMEEGKGFKIAMSVLNSGRGGLAAGILGAQKKLIKLCTQYALERKQFGKSISEYGLIQKKIAQMMREAYATESLTYLTSGLIDQGVTDYSLESAISKVFASEALWRTVNEALQICAGNGYMKEYPYEQILRDSRINMIFEGTNEILRIFIALSGMKDPADRLKEVSQAMKEPIKSIGLISEFAVRKVKKSLSIDRFSKIHPIFKNMTTHLEEYIHDLAQKAESVLARHGKNVVDKQFALERISEISIEIYMMIATLMRATSNIEKCGIEKAKPHILITKAICKRSLRRIKMNLKRADHNDDEEIKEIARYAYEKQGYDLDVLPA
ncbi:MAG: acyl-CoA dehydrogenase family protein [Deltaproteobacteria bacterium]|nr:acyl-CoA dehydrogenase family protein [Deltaproteobacteria bacterium]